MTSPLSPTPNGREHEHYELRQLPNGDRYVCLITDEDRAPAIIGYYGPLTEQQVQVYSAQTPGWLKQMGEQRSHDVTIERADASGFRRI